MSNSILVHTSSSPAFLADEESRRPWGRYHYGACDRGLPLTGEADGSCSGDCHPASDDDGWEFLSMPDPVGTTRLEIIANRLEKGGPCEF